MDWGSLNHVYKAIMMKRLSAHEVDPEVSNQHEFQGVKRMMAILGEEKREDISTVYRFFRDEGDQPDVHLVVKAAATWYDGREKDPDRSAEWRLYYKTNSVWDCCHVGDLLVLALRQDETLDLYFAPKDSVSELMLMEAFGATANEFAIQAAEDTLRKKKDQEGYQPASQAVTNLQGVESVEQLSLVLSSDQDSLDLSAALSEAVDSKPETLASSDDHVGLIASLYQKRWPGGKLVKSREVAEVLTKEADFEKELGVDVAVAKWLEIAEAAYWVWEKSVCVDFLKALRWDKAISDEELAARFSKRWMSFRQSRVSRAGGIMECLLEIVFRRNGLEFDTKAAAATDGGKLPDFLFPSGAAYKDDKFPVGHLRILGCKNSFKDRWPQILDEGKKVVRKHGATRDSKITKSMFQQMDDRQLTVVMPTPIIEKYSHKPSNLISIRVFMDEILAIQKK